MHSRARSETRPFAPLNGTRLLSGAVVLLLAASGLVLSPPSSASAVVTPGQPVVIDGFDGTVHGTRSVATLPAAGTATTAPGTFSESNGAAFITATGNGNAAGGVKLSYSFPQSDLTAGGNNTQLFFEFDSIARTPERLGQTAMSVTATITDANGVTGTYNTGIGNTSAFNVVLNFRCVDGPPCFSPQPDFTRVTGLTVSIMYPQSHDPEGSLSTVLKVIRTTPTGGLPPAAPSPVISTPTASIVSEGTPSIDYSIRFVSEGRVLSTNDFDASDITVMGTAPGASVSGFQRAGDSYTVTVGPLSDSGTVSLGVAGGVFIDGWGQPSQAASARTVTFTKAVPPVITGLPDASYRVGTAATSPTVVAGTPAPSFSATGLPAGLSMSTAGVVSGTPAPGSGGVHTVTITATNVAGSDTETFTVTVAEAPSVSIDSTPAFTIGSAGSAALTLGGYPAPTLAVTAGELPAGLSLSQSGVLSGTPTGGAGVHTVTVTATNVHGTTDAVVSFVVTLAPTITSADEVDLVVGSSAEFQATASGYPLPEFSVLDALPGGLSVAADGALSGVPAAGTGGEHTVRLRASNSAGSTERPLTLVIGEAPSVTAPVSPSFTIGQSGTAAVTATGYPAPTVVVTEGALPAGLTLSPSGVLSGTPTADAGPHAVTVTASNAHGSASTTLSFPVLLAPSITSPDELTLRVGDPSGFTATASGYPAPVFSAIDPLPAGLSLAAGGSIVGTPAAGTGGAHSIRITASNSVETVTQTLALTIEEAPGIAAPATLGVYEGDALAAPFDVSTSGYPRPSLALRSGDALPDGLTLVDHGDGTASIVGTPASGTAGVYEIVIVASSPVAGLAAASTAVSVEVGAAPRVATPSAQTLRLGVPVDLTVAATGHPVPAFTPGTVVPGVTIDAAGRISGTPTATGASTVSVSASNVWGMDSASFPVSVTDAPAVVSASAATFAAGVAGTVHIATAGFPVPMLSVVGTLPHGVTFTDAGDGTGTLAGTPAAGTGGAHEFSIVASNALGESSQDFTLTITEAPVVDTGTTGPLRLTVDGSGSLSLAGGGFPAPVFALTAGSLPAGLTLAPDGRLVGSPLPGAGGRYAFTVEASNAHGTQSLSVELVVNEVPSVTSEPEAEVRAGAPVSITITTLGYPAPSLEVLAGQLPAGLVLVDNGDGTATISGTPQRGAGGVYTLLLGASQPVPAALAGTAFASLAGLGSAAVQHTLTLTVMEAPDVPAALTLSASAGEAVSLTFDAIGYPFPALALSGLPAGLSFTDNGDGTATISGTPAASGTFSLPLRASNSLGADSGEVTLVVAAAPGTAGLVVTGTDAAALVSTGLGLVVLGLVVLGVALTRRRRVSA